MEAVVAQPPSLPGQTVKFAPYDPVPMRRDESKDPNGEFRLGWSGIYESVGRHGDSVLTSWRKEAARISRQRGLAYRPDKIDGSNPSGSWSLDPIPWVFAPETWKPVESGLAQRMRLFSAILADLYGGGQRILAERLMPAEIIFGHRGFRRELHDILPGTNAIGLGMTGMDLAYDTGGQLFALNDRFDCPFGLGLALENRTVVNAVLPNLFRRCHVRRIGYFYINWFNYLLSQAPSGSENPVIAILDATPEDQDSEISFLANYCGISRITPGDLTVRDAKLWLKALSGLHRVDLIWKHAAGRDLDSLESDHSFPGGITGLFEAMRQQNVAVASHPGCEVLQSPGFFPYLAKICKALLDEPLEIPPVATWWCGAPSARSHVLDKLSSMVVKPVGHHSDFSTVYGSRLSRDELAKLKARIEAEPGRYVGQEELVLSTVPVSTNSGLTPRGAVLRTFSFLGIGGIPNVMPGGLARVNSADGAAVSTRQGGESKDVWVLTEREDSPVSIARELLRTRIVNPDVVPSRVAENLFWTGRNAERTDFISRFATRVLAGRTLGFSHDAEFEARHENILVNALFELNQCESWFEVAPDADARLGLILRDPACPVGIGMNLANLRRAARATREKWSPTSILAVESICDGWNEAAGPASIFSAIPRLETLQLNLAAFLGLNLDTMTRDEGWALLDAGRRIERAQNLAGLLAFLLRQDVEEQLEALLVESVLFISDSLGTYQSVYLTEPKTGPMLRLLLGERDYGRSMHYLLARLHTVLAKLPKPATRRHPNDRVVPAIEHLSGFVAKLDRDSDDPAAIKQYAIDDLKTLLGYLSKLCDHLTKSYFSHAEKSQ